VRPNVARTGHVSGISYRLDHVAVKGSQLGRAYTWEGLQRQQGVAWDRTRDMPAVERAVRATEGQAPPRERLRPTRPRVRPGALSPSRLGGRAARKVLGRLPGASRALAVVRLGQSVGELVRKPTLRHATAALVRTGRAGRAEGGPAHGAALEAAQRGPRDPAAHASPRARPGREVGHGCP
jgi:hypothetical protein